MKKKRPLKSSRFKILTINCGSSTVKYQLFDGNDLSWLVRGQITEIGNENGEFRQERKNGSEVRFSYFASDYKQAIKKIVESLLTKKAGVLSDISDIYAVGHRVVHGGEFFSEPVLITDEVLDKIEQCSALAPLHNPYQLQGIRACQELFPGIPQVAVFDTAFHQTIPKHAFIYGIPYRYYEKYRIRRYGFHGTSHFYVSRRAAELAGIPFSNAKIITCHLGNGSSIAAIRNGQCIDTSMGFTPLEGLVMGSRSGDIDVSAVLFLMQNENLSPQEADQLLNKESGLKGISEYSNNMRLLLQRADAGDEKSKLAVDVFCYRVKKYIGSYVAALNGLDLLVFTGGIGENSPSIRTKILAELDFLGIQPDHFINRQVEHSEAKISRDDSLVQVWVVPTNEELVIASQTLDLIYSK